MMSSMSGPDKAKDYSIFVHPDLCTDGSFCWVAEHPDLPGCAAHSRSLREAKELLAHARAAYLTYLLAQNVPFPTPGGGAEEWQSTTPDAAKESDLNRSWQSDPNQEMPATAA
jgi:predicted RNase H-like HicB family nuclease